MEYEILLVKTTAFLKGSVDVFHSDKKGKNNANVIEDIGK